MFHADSTRLAIAASLLLVFPMAGCNRKPLPKTGSMGLAQSRSQGRDFTQIDAANSGTITGTLHYAGNEPGRIVIDMAQDPACSMSDTNPNMTQQVAVHNGGLANGWKLC